MKQRIGILKVLLLVLAMQNVTLSNGQNKRLSLDSLEISLLTCSPRQQIYSLYGHTAIRLRDMRTGLDVAVNYGVFSFDKPLFVPRFVFGMTDYEIGIIPFKYFIKEYKDGGSRVVQQVLNLTPDEKMLVFDAIQVNLLPENKYYRYNFFYDNCTTRARDIIVNNIKGGINYTSRNGGTFREIIHQKNEHYPWARFGNDLLLGIGSDMPTTQEQRQFLPDNLMYDFENATRNDNHKRLVEKTTTIIDAKPPVLDKGFPLTPNHCALLLLVITIVITIVEFVKSTRMIYFDVFLMLFVSTTGIILFLMIFSQHPTVRLNLQILILNPLPFFFIKRLIKRHRKGIKDKQHIIWVALACLFFIGGFFQLYADGMYLLALSLLIRSLKGLLSNCNTRLTIGSPEKV
ncbi:DUF4105 domain-containing protein [Prevotella sp. OH937_COT-195]|uniref:Lnb N-terminal periplasmic domain-containing protein n=1 Tax=Prevotella sp. OH937_COT-195 TaxID=2491051 RepID=UPI001F19A1BE|nr:DUF4105 domain-containing protein [Prevotella sp. OH937_COT-195]